MSIPQPLETGATRAVGVDEAVSDLLKQWRLEDATPLAPAHAERTGQLPGHRSGNGLVAILRYLTFKRQAS